MKRAATLVLVLSALMLSAGHRPKHVGAAPADGVSVQTDALGSTAFTGLTQTVRTLDGTSKLWRLRSWIDPRDHSLRHQLYIQTRYLLHWRGWSLIEDDTGQRPVDRINQSIEDCRGYCGYVETVGVALDDGFLRSRAGDGFEVTLISETGDRLVVPVSSAQIEAQFTAIGQYADAHGGPGPARPSPPPLR